MSYKVEAVTKYTALGEGPHWDVPSQTLYFIDIVYGSVHSYKPSTNEYHKATVGNGPQLPVSLIVPVEGQKNKFVITIKNEVAIITWDGKSPKTSEPEVIATVEPKENGNRINDGKCDANGRLWAGTMGKPGPPDGLTYQPCGSFYSVSNNNVVKHLDGIKCSNGLAWSSDNKKFYYADSFKYRVDSYDYDLETGTLSNEKTVFDFKANNIPGIPDGMTIDTEGKLLVANFDGSQVLRIDPETRTIISTIKIPALQVTSAVFGGPNMDELYVTSANIDPKTDFPAKENGTNGCVFKVTNTGLRGLPLVNFKL